MKRKKRISAVRALPRVAAALMAASNPAFVERSPCINTCFDCSFISKSVYIVELVDAKIISKSDKNISGEEIRWCWGPIQSSCPALTSKPSGSSSLSPCCYSSPRSARCTASYSTHNKGESDESSRRRIKTVERGGYSELRVVVVEPGVNSAEFQ